MKKIEEVHCRCCGNIVGDECGEWDGYTSCCNKPTAPPGCSDSCSHNEADPTDDDRPTCYGIGLLK